MPTPQQHMPAAAGEFWLPRWTLEVLTSIVAAWQWPCQIHNMCRLLRRLEPSLWLPGQTLQVRLSIPQRCKLQAGLMLAQQVHTSQHQQCFVPYKSMQASLARNTGLQSTNAGSHSCNTAACSRQGAGKDRQPASQHAYAALDKCRLGLACCMQAITNVKQLPKFWQHIRKGAPATAIKQNASVQDATASSAVTTGAASDNSLITQHTLHVSWYFDPAQNRRPPALPQPRVHMDTSGATHMQPQGQPGPMTSHAHQPDEPAVPLPSLQTAACQYALLAPLSMANQEDSKYCTR